MVQQPPADQLQFQNRMNYADPMSAAAVQPQMTQQPIYNPGGMPMMPNNPMNPAAGIDFNRAYGPQPPVPPNQPQPPFPGHNPAMNPNPMGAPPMAMNAGVYQVGPNPAQGGRPNNRNYNTNTRNYQQQNNNGVQKRMRRY